MNPRQVLIYILDPRLPEFRSVTTEIHFARAPTNSAMAAVGNAPVFSVLAPTMAYAQPASVDLIPGCWAIRYVDHADNEINHSFQVVEGEDPQVVVLSFDEVAGGAGYGERSGSLSDASALQRNAETALNIQNRRLAPSRGNETRSKPQNVLLPVCAFNIYKRRDVPARPHVLFKDLTTFDEKTNFWLANWKQEATPIGLNLNWQFESSLKENVCTARTSIAPSTFEALVGDEYKATLNLTLGDQHYLLLLPLPWKSERNNADTLDLEIDYFYSAESTSNDRLLNVRIFTDNSKFDAVTRLLGSGKFSSAMRIWDRDARDLLWGKYQNPMSAAAAALVLVQAISSRESTSFEKSAEWVRWVTNLCNDFPWLPEGAICKAWLLGSDSNTSDNPGGTLIARKAQAAGLFAMAVDRGIPTFCEAVRLLGKGVEWASDELEPNVRQAVSWLSMHLVPGSATVVLRIPKS